MNSGKKQQLQKTREPYGKVIEVGQVPVALQEILELAKNAKENLLRVETLATAGKLDQIARIADSIIAVTCANPGCLSQMAEQMKVQ